MSSENNGNTAELCIDGGITLEITFMPEKAPNTVARITQLIGDGFYDGIVFHRVVPGFCAQAGDPTGTGSGGSGVKLKAEFNDVPHDEGILSMARKQDPDSADSQFFITLGRHEHLDGAYTVFGKVVAGAEDIHNIKQGAKIQSFRLI